MAFHRYSFKSTIEDVVEGTMAGRGEQPYHTARKMKEVIAYVALDCEAEVASEGGASGTLQDEPLDLPNGEHITVGNSRFIVPEALFMPALLGSSSAGLHELVAAAVDACDPELHDGMYSNITLCGGTTMLPGLSDRLKKELVVLRPACAEVAAVVSPPGRRNAGWAAGAALALTTRFTGMWVTRKEYAEFGAKIVDRKCI